jgi:hypothetical protein
MCFFTDNSDLHLVIDKDNLTQAAPMNEVPGFGYIWAGARATYGFTKGQVFYEVKVRFSFSFVSVWFTLFFRWSV